MTAPKFWVDSSLQVTHVSGRSCSRVVKQWRMIAYVVSAL
jgi:hypothetical protein